MGTIDEMCTLLIPVQARAIECTRMVESSDNVGYEKGHDIV